MNYKIGQRVRILRVRHPLNAAWVGREGVVIATGLYGISSFDGEYIFGHYGLDVDGIGRRGPNGNQIAFPGDYLAPLTDPKADAFIESLKRLEREPLTKETA